MAILYIGNYPKPSTSNRDDLTIDSIEALKHSHRTCNNNAVSLYEEINLQIPSDNFDPLSIASCVVPYLNAKGGRLNVLTSSSRELIQKVHTAFLLAGLKVQSESVNGENRVFAAEYNRQKSNAAKIGQLNFEEKKLDVDHFNIVDVDDDDMIDEDDLLDAGVIAPPPAVDMDAVKAASDCGGRKACDDCTCGRAEQETAVKKDAQAPTSSCGNCAKGDAVSMLSVYTLNNVSLLLNT